MIRPHLDITIGWGRLATAYPPMQWNETTSQYKILTDVREWLHNHHPDWCRAMVYLSHYNGTESYSDKIMIERALNARNSLTYEEETATYPQKTDL